MKKATIFKYATITMSVALVVFATAGKLLWSAPELPKSLKK